MTTKTPSRLTPGQAARKLQQHISQFDGASVNAPGYRELARFFRAALSAAAKPESSEDK